MTSLSTELEMLLLSACLYVIQVLVPAAATDLKNGRAWGLSNRSNNPPESTEWGERSKRACANMAENLLPFACLVLVVEGSGNSGEWSMIGALVFFYSRLAHAILYIAGITILRSIAYLGGLIGMAMMIYQVV